MKVFWTIVETSNSVHVTDRPGLSVKEFLSEHEHSAYTTMRTIHSDDAATTDQDYRIVEFDAHINRLVESFNGINNDELRASKAELEESLMRTAKSLLVDCGADLPVHSDLRLTVVVGRNRKQDNLACLEMVSEVLPKIPESCQVELAYGRRVNVHFKDSDWVKKRSALERNKLPESNEVVLVDEGTTELTEGLSSNFFVVRGDSVVMTAPDSAVLSGTIRKLVIEGCAEFSIDLIFKCPLKPQNDWRSAFITSTSRLLLPVDRMVDRTQSPP